MDDENLIHFLINRKSEIYANDTMSGKNQTRSSKSSCIKPKQKNLKTNGR